MQQERREAVKESTCCSMRGFGAAGMITATFRRGIRRARWTPQPGRNSPEIRVQRFSDP
jgi:hypothetical protein